MASRRARASIAPSPPQAQIRTHVAQGICVVFMFSEPLAGIVMPLPSSMSGGWTARHLQQYRSLGATIFENPVNFRSELKFNENQRKSTKLNAKLNGPISGSHEAKILVFPKLNAKINGENQRETQRTIFAECPAFRPSFVFFRKYLPEFDDDSRFGPEFLVSIHIEIAVTCHPLRGARLAPIASSRSRARRCGPAPRSPPPA